MFHRRLYFIVPEESHAVQIVADLEAAGVDRQHIHAIAGKGMTLEKLPAANEHQRQRYRLAPATDFVDGQSGVVCSGQHRHDRFRRLQGSRSEPFCRSPRWRSHSRAGILFATRVPDTHLDEFRGVLSHQRSTAHGGRTETASGGNRRTDLPASPGSDGRRYRLDYRGAADISQVYTCMEPVVMTAESHMKNNVEPLMA